LLPRPPQFWSAYASADQPGLASVEETLEQIDLVRRVVSRCPGRFELGRTAANNRRIHRDGKIA
jgi:hypothetical protein